MGLYSFHSLTRVKPKENVPKASCYTKPFVIQGEKMADILYEAAVEYQKLRDTAYKILVGRKNQSYEIMLHFPPESFFHLAGLQHLEDVTFPSTNKERIYKEILKRKLTINDINSSSFYEKWFIEERLSDFKFLRDMIETNSFYYKINSRRYIQYTDIKADYLCEHKQDINTIYLFLVIQKQYPRFKNECKGCSLFTKHDYDYSNGTSKTTTLLIEKVENGNNEVIFRNPSYVEKDVAQ